MKSILLATLASTVTMFAASAALAEINVDVGLGEPAYYEPQPVYVAPQPVYVAHPAYYRTYAAPHHEREYDWNYWNHRDAHPVVVEHRDIHPEPHHDNGNHNGEWHR